MRKSGLFTCCLLLLAAFTTEAQQASSTIRFKTIEELRQFLVRSENRYPLVSAHRGGPEKGFPENAIETFEHSSRYQPLVIECDIALSKDSALVMMHDDKLDRTTTGTGLIGEYTLEELKKLNLKDNDGNITAFHIPTLDEVLLWGKDKVLYTLDVKRGVPFARVIEAVRRCKAEAWSVIITYNADQAKEVHELAPDLMISVSVSSQEAYDRLHANGVPDNRMVAFVGVREPDAALYSFLHERKIMCIVGTMGNLDRQAAARGDQLYYDLIDRGADILSSDRTIEAGKQLQQYVRDHRIRSPHVYVPRQEAPVDTTQKVVPGRVNSEASKKKPYVILISLDGFRYDYANKYNASHIQALAKQGVSAASMKPSYPSVTFPNHYTIATGLYPSHHGLVANWFYDESKDRSYSMSNKKEVGDSSWYGGTPLWVLAEENQLLSASMFWVGSEAAVKNTRATYSFNYTEKIGVDRRIAIVKDWLSLPEDKRPHLITFYINEPDHSGHNYGPDAPQTAEAVHMVDTAIYRLTEAVQHTGLPVNFVLVADHGMTTVDTTNWISFPAAIDTTQFIIQSSGTTVCLYAKDKQAILPLYKQLKQEAKGYQVYLKNEVPAYLHYGAADDRYNRIGDILLLPTWPKVFAGQKPKPGYHGFDPSKVKDMHAIFYAWGPAFKKGITIPTFENVHVYPLIAGLLGLPITEKIDGNKKVLQIALK
ncbi:MAG: alkaline phosphatase family protein [Niastella sp.]|nr:alkaline phosphatase family protein [Niastella sp.]